MTQDQDILNIVYIGAGEVAFGNENVSWNHSVRIENLLGTNRLKVLALVEPNEERASSVLKEKANSPYSNCYSGTKRFINLDGAKEFLSSQKVDLVMNCAPPYFRGTTIEGRNLEAQLINIFGANLPMVFTEKPISMARPEQLDDLLTALNPFNDRIGVGYMMRYLKVVQKAMSIIKQENLKIMALHARYNNAYKLSVQGNWWRKSYQGGPMVEQGTHFCDLLRYFGGDVDLDTVQVNTLEHDEPVGKIYPVYFDDSGFETEDRIPLCTSATWKHKSGTVTSFTHAVALHGVHFSDEICIIADGYQMRIVNVYKDPVLYVRSPASDTVEQVFNYPGDDMYKNEMWSALSNAAKISGKKSISTLDDDQGLYSDKFLTSYQDAFKTLELTWRLRDLSDASARRGRTKRQRED